MSHFPGRMSVADFPVPFAAEFEDPGRFSEPVHVVCGRTYLVSSHDPQLEVTVTVPRVLRTARLGLAFDGLESRAPGYGGRWQSLLNRVRSVVALPADRPWLDLRPLGMTNWSHALNAGVPLALKVRDLVRASGGDRLSVLLPDPVPSKVAEVLRHLDFECLSTNAPARGPLVRVTPRPSQTVHFHARDWIAPHKDRFRALAAGAGRALPRRFFLSRRGGRSLRNDAEVTALLAARGYETVFAEDLTPGEQLALFLRAEDIVAIHGAGLAPLLYRDPEDGPFRLVEILSPGHMTLFFRWMMQPLPVDYRAVRGNPDAWMAIDAWRLDRLRYAKRHGLSRFHLDVDALEVALSEGGVDGFVRWRPPLPDGAAR